MYNILHRQGRPFGVAITRASHASISTSDHLHVAIQAPRQRRVFEGSNTFPLAIYLAVQSSRSHRISGLGTEAKFRLDGGFLRQLATSRATDTASWGEWRNGDSVSEA